MATSKLDQIVKGAPPPGTSVPTVTSRSPSPTPPDTPETEKPPPPPPDSSSPLSSSPPQIYLNLLILEASLRSQYLTLRDRRRQNVFFILLLSSWVAGFTYLLFFRLREDGSGVGGSVYWVVEMAEKVALMVGVVTGILMWGTGQWDRGVRWPRRWLGIANRGLRSINTKIVVIQRSWWKELLGHLVFLFPYSAFFPSTRPSLHQVEAHHSRPGVEDDLDMLKEEDLLPGGDHIKLLLLPKPFSPDFRENWELYRSEYWEKENARRAQLRQALHRRGKVLAKGRGGWLWGSRGRGSSKLPDSATKGDIEKSHPRTHPEKDRQRRHSMVRSDSRSRNASRSSTPSTLDAEERPALSKARSGSTTASASERRKRSKTPSSAEDRIVSQLSPISRPA